MPIAATIEFPRGDVDALFRQIDRSSRLLGKDMVHSLNSAAMFVARSLGASAKVAPKERKVQELAISTSKREGVKSWGVTGWFGRPRTYQTKILRTSKGEAYVKERLGMIRRRGLAKKTMANMGKKVGGLSSVHMGGGAEDLARLAAKHGTSERGGGSDDPWIRMTNDLNYATDSLKDGDRSIETAMGRAASAMEKSIDAQLRRKFGLS